MDNSNTLFNQQFTVMKRTSFLLKTDPSMRHTTRPGKIVVQVIFFLFISVASLSFALVLAKSGPRRVERVQRNSVAEQRELTELKEKSRELWERFTNVSEHRPELTAEDINILKEALALREDFLMRTELTGLVDDPEMIIEPMRKKWAEIQARICRKKSAEIEKLAEAARDKADYPAAAKMYQEALDFENKIADEFSLSGLRDTGRIAYLRTEIKRANGRPIWEASQQLEKEGDALFNKKEWEEAAKKYTEALAQEEALSVKYHGMFDSSYLRPEKLLSNRDTAASSVENEKNLTLIATMKELAAAGKYDEAEKQWEDIFTRYDEMRREHPRSRYVQEDAAEARTKERDSVLSAGRVKAIGQRLTALDESLRAGKTDGVGSEALLILQEADRVLQKYPNAVVLNTLTRKKLSYISFKASEILLVQRRLAEMLRPIPECPGVLLLTTEVPQTLYTALLEGKNPSAIREDFLPVDSVAYKEALEFCERLGWITGRHIRLPSLAELTRAVGTVDRAALSSQAWSFENSEDKPHRIGTKTANANGFHDLLGNLSEWTLSNQYSDDAADFGGNYQNNLDTLVLLPSEIRPKHDKNRLRGFRILVDNNPPAPEADPPQAPTAPKPAQ